MQHQSLHHKEAIRNHANRNILFILDKLGVTYNDRGNGLLQAYCPCKHHGGDRTNPTAWSWRIDIGHWMCWSHNCQDKYGGDAFGLVRSMLDLSFIDACDWLYKTLSEHDIDLAAAVAPSAKREFQLHIHEPLPENNLRFLQPDPEYLINRGFDRDILRQYQVGTWTKLGSYMHGRVVFPIRDHEGYLVGYTGRTIYTPEYFEKLGKVYKKWIHGRHYNKYPKPDEKVCTGSILYNLHNAIKCLSSNREIILVEGPLDGMKLQEAGVRNWAANLGVSFGPNHRTLLIKYNIKALAVAYDNDDPAKYEGGENPGSRGFLRVKKVVGNLFDVRRVEPPPDIDWGDMSVPAIQSIFKKT